MHTEVFAVRLTKNEIFSVRAATAADLKRGLGHQGRAQGKTSEF